MRILVIDDEQEIRGLVKRILERSGHEILCAANGKEGLAFIRTFDPDLVIVDMIMPEMDGAEMIRHLETKIAESKIIVMTGNPCAAPIRS